MRVCFVSHSARRYGAELALLELLQGLKERGVECLVLVPRRGPLLGELDRLGVEWRILNYWWWLKSRRLWLPHRILRMLLSLISAIRVAALLRRWRCDVVYTNTIAIPAGALAAWLARTPHVWHLHESAFRDSALKFDPGTRLALRLIDRLSIRVIVVSDALRKEYMKSIDPGKLRRIYQSVSLPDVIGEQTGSAVTRTHFQCAMIGSLEPRKGQAEAIEALSRLVRRGVDVRLQIVGGDEKCFRDELQKQVVRHGMETRAEFTGYVNDPARFIAAADAILMCSRWEAFGRVTVASMLAGKPVIAMADSGATAELIQDGVTGLLYMGGRPDDLADKIQYLHENPQERARLGTAACAWAEGRFTRDRYAGQVFALLAEATAEKE